MRTKRLVYKEVLEKGSKLELKPKYFVLLAEQKAHENFHPIGEAALSTRKVHPKVIHKIYDLVADGICCVQEVKKALRHYVLHVLIPEIKIKPDEANRAYFPATTDIQNHV